VATLHCGWVALPLGRSAPTPPHLPPRISLSMSALPCSQPPRPSSSSSSPTSRGDESPPDGAHGFPHGRRGQRTVYAATAVRFIPIIGAMRSGTRAGGGRVGEAARQRRSFFMPPPIPAMRSPLVATLRSPPAVADPRLLQAPTPDPAAPPLLHLHRDRLTSAPPLPHLYPAAAARAAASPLTSSSSHDGRRGRRR
jgi:hypothetical protein